MIKNQRAYQLIYSKTHSRTLAYAVGICAKVCGICLCELTAWLDKEYVSESDITSAHARLERIYPKPKQDSAPPPLLPMDESVDVSVIIPAYNAEEYINACVDSVLRQSAKCSVEIIIVNDNSTDTTMQCLEKYSSNRAVQIIDFKNGGNAAKARNEGILHCRGRYIMFVDSDDRLPRGAIEALMCAIENTASDIACGGWQYIDGVDAQGLYQGYATAVYDGKNRLTSLELSGVPWGKLYKMELFENVRFPSEYTCFEDAAIHFLVFRSATRITSISENVYYWRKNPNGLTQTSQNRAKALQSYWIVEQMLAEDERIGLAHDDMLAACLIGQLSNFCYVNISGINSDVQKSVFALCCDLYQKHLAKFDFGSLPYALKVGARALRERRYDLWVKQGKLYQLIR